MPGEAPMHRREQCCFGQHPSLHFLCSHVVQPVFVPGTVNNDLLKFLASEFALGVCQVYLDA